VTANPTNAKALFAAYFFASEYKSEEVATPERRKYLEALKAADPKNSLPWYLSARDHFKAGQPTDGPGRAAKPRARCQAYDYYASSTCKTRRTRLRLPAIPTSRRRRKPRFSLPLPHLAQLRDLSRALVEQATAARQAAIRRVRTICCRSG